MRRNFLSQRANPSRRRRAFAFLRPELLVLAVIGLLLALFAARGEPARADLELLSGGGALSLSNSKEGSAVLSLAPMRPGDTVTGNVTLGNTGTIPGDLTLSTSNLLDVPGGGGGALSATLELRVRDVTNPGSPVTVYDGPIPSLSGLDLGSLAAGASRDYEFRVTFPDGGAGDDAYQGSSMTAQFDWEATNPGTGDTTPPETSITAAPAALVASADASFSFTADETGSTFECSLDGAAFAPCTSPAAYTGLGDGAHTFDVRATDTSANTDPSPAGHSWTIDATPPTASLNDPGALLRGTVNLTSSTSDGGSGVASVVYQRSPAGTGTWSAVAASWDTTGVADGAYDLRVVATDAAGNSTASAPVAARVVDNTAPALASSVPADGTLLTTAASVTVVASEPLGAVQSATLDGAAAPAPLLVGSSATFAATLADGPHVLAGELEDLAGNRRPFRVHFTVWNLAAADYPYIEANWPSLASVSLTATNGDGAVAGPVGGWNGGAPGDWIVLRVDPRPAALVGNGFEPSGDILDVTAYWALAGGSVTSFVLPLDIVVHDAAADAVPTTFENGAWRGIAPVPSGQTLPASWQDGYYRVGTDVHILTRHLSSFSLLRDVQAPGAPTGFHGERKNGRLVLGWKAATDNSGVVDAYVVHANGAPLKTLGASARSVDLGEFKTADRRRFQVAARDAAGNLGAKTHEVVIVPSLSGLSLAKAQTALTGRGLQVGTITRARSETVPAGSVIKAGKTGCVPAGTKVGLTVSLGAGGSGSTGSAGGSGSGGSGGTGGGSGGSTGGGTGSFGGSGGGTGGSGSSPSVPSNDTPPSLAPSQPPVESGPAPEGGEESSVPTISPAPTSSSSDGDGGLRKALGLGLLSAAFLGAAGAWWRFRGFSLGGSPGPATDEIVFWDQRLARAAVSTARRLTGRRTLG